MIKFLHLARKRQPEIAAPGFSSALGRVRDMREHADWPPATNQGTIHQRGERVADVRRQVTIPPLASERESPKLRLADRGFLEIWNSLRSLFYGSAFVVFVFCVVSLLPEPQPKPIEFPDIVECTIAFALPDAPQYGSLTGEQAQTFRQKALAALGLKPTEWWPMHYRYGDPEPYIGRVSNYEATMRFIHEHDRYMKLEVTVKLDPEGKYILCSIKRK